MGLGHNQPISKPQIIPNSNQFLIPKDFFEKDEILLLQLCLIREYCFESLISKEEFPLDLFKELLKELGFESEFFSTNFQILKKLKIE